MSERRWTDDEGAEGHFYNGRLSITAKPSMTREDGVVIVGIDVGWLERADGEYLYLLGWQPAPGWTTGAVEALVDVSAYLEKGRACERCGGAGQKPAGSRVQCERCGGKGNEPEWRWCRLDHVAPGSAAVYPFKVKVPGRGVGQFKADEVRVWRAEREVLEATGAAHLENGDRHGRWPE